MISPNEGQMARSPYRLIRIEELADLLSLSKRTVSRMMSSGRMPAPVRLGGSLRWQIDDVEQWIAKGCPMPDAA